MAILKNDKHKEYARYAEHCLHMVTVATEQDARAIQSEMAAEWLKLADSVRRRSRPRKCRWSDRPLSAGRARQLP
jgi:hypothetical protein